MGTCIAVLSPAGCATRTKRDVDQSQVRYQLALGYFQNHHEEAAVEELQKAIQADPKNADPYNMLGLIALKEAHDYEAQAETASCLKGEDERLVRAEETKKLLEAEGHFHKAVELRPSFPEAWNSLAAVALLLRSWDEAIADAEHALGDAVYGSPVFARANLGWAYFHKGDLQDAWKELYEAVSRAPTFCVARYRLAKVYLERGATEQAIEAIDPLIATASAARFRRPSSSPGSCTSGARARRKPATCSAPVRKCRRTAAWRKSAGATPRCSNERGSVDGKSKLRNAAQGRTRKPQDFAGRRVRGDEVVGFLSEVDGGR